ncbi:unnamed protein product [Toxocara canis]|uniref:Lipocalin n=1 Tax=Toxocara canis TaxID=6265 RepID=A0A183UN22_TOXCA|nr:unnamed protein product [Toxocara canis]
MKALPFVLAFNKVVGSSTSVMLTVSKSFLLLVIATLTIRESDARKRRILNEVTVINNVGRNLKLRCQSILTDLRDQWLEPEEKFSFTFYDFDRGCN